MRVLYVDDDRIQTLLFTETCRAAGLTDVEVAGDGAEALQGLRDWAPWRPDLLVLDLHLPDTDGLRLLPALRAALAPAAAAHTATPAHPPAILCTADEPRLVAAAARAAGFDDCWTKPVTTTLLQRAVQRFGAPSPP
jgi:CheY-like chemotaxis protein